MKVFINSNFSGDYTMRQMKEIEKEFYKNAYEFFKNNNYSHVIYSHYDILDGEIEKVWFYENYGVSEKEFDRISIIPNCYIGVIHKHE